MAFTLHFAAQGKTKIYSETKLQAGGRGLPKHILKIFLSFKISSPGGFGGILFGWFGFFL